jgi:hypothetical protein
MFETQAARHACAARVSRIAVNLDGAGAMQAKRDVGKRRGYLRGQALTHLRRADPVANLESVWRDSRMQP